MARYYRKRGIWYAWGILASGERWTRSTRSKDQREAHRVGRGLERDVLSAADVSARARTSLTAAFSALYASQKTRGLAAGSMRSATQRGGHVLRLLGVDRDLATLLPPMGSEVLRGYVAARVAEGAMRSTAAAEVSMLKQALRTAARAGTWSGDTRALEVIELKRAHRPRRVWLTPEQAKLVAAKIPAQWREHFEVYVNTGVRRMELYAITANDLDLVGNRVHVRGTKTELADRWLPLTKRARAILVGRARRGALPFNEWTRILPDLKAACVAAEVHRVTVTDLRRTFGSILLSEGVSSSVLKELFGHATTKQIDLTYGMASDDAKQRAVALHPSGSRAVAGTGAPLRQKRRKTPAPAAISPQNAIRRSTSGNHFLAALAGLSPDFGGPVAHG